METGKCICWLRGSTDKQEIDSQRKELTEIATKKEGFSPSDIIYIGKAGASAIKQNDLYMQEVDELLNTLSKDSSVKTVFVWEISRLARVELAFYKMKDFFISNKIQLICQTPTLRLFDSDGTINKGTELTLSLLITLAKQEMEIKQARFKRGRDRAREEGKFGGGAFGAMYGYMVDSGGYVVPNPSEVEKVNEIFNLYATGNYSTYTLSDELRKRGFTCRGRKVNSRKIQKIISNTAYIGFLGIRKYPQIVDTTLFEKVSKIRKNKDIVEVHTTKETRHIHFGIRHLKCRECGCNFIVLSKRYCCYKHHHKDSVCSCSDGISIEWFDKIIWDVAQLEHIEYLTKKNEESVGEYEKKIQILNEKIAESRNKMDNLQVRKERIQELYMNGDITKAKYDSNKGKITADYISYQAEIERYMNEIERNEDLIYRIKNPTEESYINIVADVSDEEDKKKIKEIIDLHIGNCYVSKTKHDDYNAIEIIINTVKGVEHKFHFCYGAKKMYKWNSWKSEWYDYYPSHEEMKKLADEFYESMGTTSEEYARKLVEEEQIESVLNDKNLSDNEKTFLISVILGRDIREE